MIELIIAFIMSMVAFALADSATLLVILVTLIGTLGVLVWLIRGYLR